MARKLYVLIILLFALISCSLNEGTAPPGNPFRLILGFEVDLDMAEPSGLTYDPTTQTLWLVNDPPSNQVYNISLEGELLQTLNYVGNDLEGIAYDTNDNTLWVAEEGNMEIVNLSLNGEELARVELDLSQTNGGGLEGLCLGNSGEFYLLKENNPGLFIEVAANFTTIQETVLTFADDYSGIYYDTSRDAFWIISDESEKLFLWNGLDGVSLEFNLSAKKFEGIYFSEEDNKFYLVNDELNKLYEYDLISNPF